MSDKKFQINTHEKLLIDLIDPISFKNLSAVGFKGNKSNFVISLLYAIEETSYYTDCNELSEKEYFEMLIKEMNRAL